MTAFPNPRNEIVDAIGKKSGFLGNQMSTNIYIYRIAEFVFSFDRFLAKLPGS